MEIPNILATGGIIAGVAAFWGQIKLFMVKLTRFVFVKSDISNNLCNSCIGYFRTHGKVYGMGDATYDASTEYVGTLDVYRTIPFETFLQPILVRLRNQWFFMQPNTNDKKEVLGVTIYAIRGTVDVDKLLSEVAAYRDALASFDSKERADSAFIPRRFAIHRRFGRAQDVVGESASPTSKGDGQRGMSYDVTRFREMSSRIIGPISYNDIAQKSNKDESPFDRRPFRQEIIDVINEIGYWLRHKEWFRERGLPWRLGVMWYGKPGNGKSSLIECIARHYDLPVIQPNLSSMTNRDFDEAWQEAEQNSPCIFAMEDFDRVFDLSENIGCKNGRGLSLETVLNAISGVRHEGGILIMVTVNDMTKVSEAMGVPGPDGRSTRPGRIDRHVEAKGPDENIRRIIAYTIMSDMAEDEIEEVVQHKDTELSYAEFTDICSEKARLFYTANLLKLEGYTPSNQITTQLFKDAQAKRIVETYTRVEPPTELLESPSNLYKAGESRTQPAVLHPAGATVSHGATREPPKQFRQLGQHGITGGPEGPLAVRPAGTKLALPPTTPFPEGAKSAMSKIPMGSTVPKTAGPPDFFGYKRDRS